MRNKLLVLITFLALLPVQAMAEDAGPQSVVKAAVDGVINVLQTRKDKAMLSTEDRDAIRKAVYGYFDFEEMARRALGKPWRQMNDTQKSEFVATFRELLERSYGNRLSEYHDQKVKYNDAVVKGRIAKVDSEVIGSDKTTPVRYWLVHKQVGWRVYDIQIEGISMINTFRTDFNDAVHKNGIEGFLSQLKDRVDGLRKQDQNKG